MRQRQAHVPGEILPGLVTGSSAPARESRLRRRSLMLRARLGDIYRQACAFIHLVWLYVYR
jgi:hypothetical protein